MDGVAIKSEVAAVYQWLGLGPTTPAGLHGPRRGIITRRHTQDDRRGRTLADALAATYPASRERPIMMLLRPQQLDDDLWRKIYAVMVTGGPIRQWDLIRSIARLTSTRRVLRGAPGAALWTAIADIEAVRLYRRWLDLSERTGQ